MGFGQEMEGCGRFMKYSMILTNVLIFLGGALCFGLGLWTVLDRGYLNELLGSNLFAGAVYVLLATGAIACCAAIFGCIGAAKEVKCVLLT
ncbi:tetraspanin-18-like, partial [Ctenocephalides felis]